MEGQSANLASKVDFGSHFGPQAGAKIRSWSDTFEQNGAQGWGTPSSSERSGADLGSIWHHKRPKDDFGAILDTFWTQFGAIFENYWVHFGVKLESSQIVQQKL